MTVRPVIQFEVPEFVVPPAAIHLWCSVERANPHFFFIVDVNGQHEVLKPVWSVKEDSVYSQHINRTISIFEPKKNYTDLKCIVTWQKEYKVKEIITERRRLVFYCK